jgi:hypothetical protein
MSDYKVYRGVASRDNEGKNYLTLDFLMATPFENVAKDYASKCPNPIHDESYIQSMIVIDEGGGVSSYPIYFTNKKL